jgi:hypothetical protein
VNQALRLPRVSPWIIVLAVALVLLAVAAVLLVVEPGLMHTIRTALPGPWHVVEECGGGGIPC